MLLRAKFRQHENMENGEKHEDNSNGAAQHLSAQVKALSCSSALAKPLCSGIALV